MKKNPPAKPKPSPIDKAIAYCDLKISGTGTNVFTNKRLVYQELKEYLQSLK